MLSNRHESTRIERLVQQMTTRHSERRFARHLENIPQVFCEVVESNESSQQMTTRHTGCRFARKYTSGHFTL